jgi:DNA-binding SARP family transcriptional activator
MPSMAYDKKNEVIHFVLENGDIYTYSLKTNILITNNKNSGYPVFEKSQQLIFDRNNQLVSYSLNQNDLSSYNLDNQTWSHTDSVTNDLPKWWHHNKLLHPITKQITTLCGYGYYSYSNSIKSFNEKSKSWKELELKGDLFEPRYCSSLGLSAENSNVAYLFGGLGNSLGKQILGKEFYYDLYKIDFEKNEIKKLWELKQNDQFQYLPVNSLKVTEKDSAFYTLMFPCQKSSTHLKVAKGFIKEPKLYFIGDSIPYEFTDIKSFADLYYWKSENKLIALTSQETHDPNYEVSMYSISYEPGADMELNMNSNSLPFSIKLFYISLASILLLLVFYVWKKMKVKNEKIENKPVFTIHEKLPAYKIPQLNSILLFGGFQVFDKKGKDATYRFSPTLKELFLLILLYSREDGKGISSRRIQEFLWPDKSEDKAKNNRGVNIKKLREILADIQGIEITFDNNYWKMILEENVFCDLAFIQKRINTRIAVHENEKIEEIIQILYRGTLLRDIVPEWLDSFKDKTTGTIVSTLEELLTKFDFESSIRMAISNVIFEFDQMNETALRVKCSLLSIQGKHSIAMETYENYIKLYVKLYNEKYQFSFKDIVSEHTLV